jgi:hypothetical protein
MGIIYRKNAANRWCQFPRRLLGNSCCVTSTRYLGGLNVQPDTARRGPMGPADDNRGFLHFCAYFAVCHNIHPVPPD